MSILKFEHRTPKALTAMYRYMVDGSKTSRHAILGIGTNPLYAIEEMDLVQRIYHMEGRLTHAYIQIIFAFDMGIRLEIEQLKKICREIGHVLAWDDRQAVGAIHYKGKDEEHIHCHYLINYLNIHGKIYRQSYSVYHYMSCVNKILYKYGLAPIECNDLRLNLTG